MISREGAAAMARIVRPGEAPRIAATERGVIAATGGVR